MNCCQCPERVFPWNIQLHDPITGVGCKYRKWVDKCDHMQGISVRHSQKINTAHSCKVYYHGSREIP